MSRVLSNKVSQAQRADDVCFLFPTWNNVLPPLHLVAEGVKPLARSPVLCGVFLTASIFWPQQMETMEGSGLPNGGAHSLSRRKGCIVGCL